MTHFAAPDQFRASIGIDPSIPISDDIDLGTASIPSGVLRPIGVSDLSESNQTINGIPLWLGGHPKAGFSNNFMYDAAGSVYTITSLTVSSCGDLNDGGSASGNGMAYYDNYMYFARDTTIARFGPLSSVSPTFTDDYWVGTLGKTALTNTPYRQFFNVSGGILGRYPNHVMHRHSDGKLYIADVVDNQGTIHYIQTKKTSVEGDTDNGSTYDKVNVGYGLWPTAMESYGTSLVIAFNETEITSGGNVRTIAKIAFWDTTSDTVNVNQITWNEFPDEYITAIKNVNGELYFISGFAPFGLGTFGFRLTRYIGGNSFEEIAKFPAGSPPPAGAVDGFGQRLVFGGFTIVPETRACAFSHGTNISGISTGIFSPIMSADSGADFITALKFIDPQPFSFDTPVLGWTDNNITHGITTRGTTYSNASSIWWSQLYKIGGKFKITKIRIPFAQAISSNMIITPKIYTDSGSGLTYTGGNSNGLAVINNTAYSGKTAVSMRPENLVGENDFWLELKWTGSALCVVNLPITIEYELLDD